MTRTPDICSSRHCGNSQSFLANLRVANHKPTQRERIYLELLDANATCEELSVRLNMRYTTVSARLSELKAMHWVTESGERRLTSGRVVHASVLRALSEAERERLLNPPKFYRDRQGELFGGNAA